MEAGDLQDYIGRANATMMLDLILMRAILRVMPPVFVVTAAGLLGGCAANQSPGSTPNPRLWLIESYKDGTITARNNGKVYTATCEGHRILKADQLVYHAVPSFPCTMAIDAVGTSVEAITMDTDFRASPLVMGKGPGGSLVLRRQDMIETFAVNSVTTVPSRCFRVGLADFRYIGQTGARWSRAEQIRPFILAARNAAIQNGESVETGTGFGDWIVWAERQADRMDPLKESPPSIIYRLTNSEPDYQSSYGYGYRKPDPPFRFPKPALSRNL